MTEEHRESPMDTNAAALRRAHALLKASLEGPTGGMMLFVDASYRYLSFNSAHVQGMRASYGVEIAAGMSMLDCMLSSEDRDRAECNFARALAGETHTTLEFFGTRKSAYYETTYYPIHDEAGDLIGAGAFARDVTDRKRAESALKKSESFIHAALENLPLIFYMIDRDGVFQLSLGAGLRPLGLKPGQAVGLSAYDMYKDYPVILDGVKRALGGEPAQLETKIGGIHHLNTMVPFFDDDGASDGLIGVALDITDRRKAEVSVAAERERLAVTLRSIGDGVITTDIAGNVVLMNRVAEQLTGLRAEEARGRPLTEVFTIIDAVTKVSRDNPTAAVMRTGDVVELSDHTALVSKDGREILIADSAAPIRDSGSNIIGVVLVFRDITEKKRLSDSLQRTQRLESLGVLAGGIAHDFNNLLGGIFGFLELAEESAEEGDLQSVGDYVSGAMKIFDRARALTQQLLTFSKGGAPIRKKMAVEGFLKKSVQFALSGSNIVSRYDISGDLLPCEFDENQLGQVLDNIVINAKQAMPDGGVLDVRAGNITLPPEKVPVSSKASEFVHIAIKDHGPGIPPDVLPRIFDPFFSTKESGHGLGLSAVFSIVQRHEGWVSVDSKMGEGATVHVYLPAATAVPSKPVASTSRTYHGTGAVLVMDDEPFMRELIGRMLESMGHTAVFAKNGEEALARFAEADGAGVSLVASILDLTIPGGMGGKETVTRLREKNESGVFIASSGYSEDPVMSEPERYGFTDCLIKPFRMGDLIRVLAAHVSAASPEGGVS